MALLLLLLSAVGAFSEANAGLGNFANAPVQGRHLSVGLIASSNALQPGASLDAGLYFKLEKGWHVYWKNAGDSGEPPTIRWTLPAGVSADPLQFPAPKRLPLGPLLDFGYEDEVVFPITLHGGPELSSGTPLALSAKVDWLVCREVCIPGKADLKLPLLVGASSAASGSRGRNAEAAALIARYQERLPRPLPSGLKVRFEATKTAFALSLTNGGRQDAAEFFPLDQNVINNPAQQYVSPLADGVRVDLKKDENLISTPKTLNGLLVLSDGTAYEIHAAQGRVAASSVGSPGGLAKVLRAAALAFVGGVILNLMPCVFPVLFIKGLALVQSSGEERGRLRAHGWVYTLGIIASFWVVVAVLLVLRAGGRQFGWGFQFQSPSFVAVMALLLFFLGLSLAGMFEIGLTLTSAGSGLAARQGYAGSFFTGVLAMVVATPCTAPFMGAAVGFALAQPAGVTLAIFTALGLGLAAPYLLLSFNPAWTRLLPRPGAWMEVLKQATAVPIFATVIWMVWLFAQGAGVDALVGLLGGFLLLAVAGWVMGRWPAHRGPFLVAALIVIAALTLPLYALRKFAAPEAAGPRIAAAGAASSSGTAWEPFSPELVAKYRAAGRPVFVDFTASWCLSCQVNERVVLDRADVQQRLRSSGVALVKADWTRHDDMIAQTLAGLGRSGVPAYALYPGAAEGAPEMLPEVLTSGIIFSALDHLQPVRASQ